MYFHFSTSLIMQYTTVKWGIFQRRELVSTEKDAIDFIGDIDDDTENKKGKASYEKNEFILLGSSPKLS